ncbi:hypothetical protein [Lentibacillus sp. Marseille-P4043]|uniref:hypothetical protein n=1 Tax=Lentibacillus sp. Marseille-P4043 TaxID=2040293 RepID=UPI000D0B8115|nr:hypothetical protein [Lentibacillus sp. Marseille-P4043]
MFVIYGLGILNLTTTLGSYLAFRRKQTLFDDRFAGTIAKTVTLAATLVLSIHFSVILTIELPGIFLLNFILGILIGILFGTFIKYHSILISFYYGLVGSSMGVMIGEVLKNPQLCSIPLTSKHEILINMMYLSGFVTLILTLILSLALYSLRV